MDTRFWGPSAWCLFHLIAAQPTASIYNISAIKKWFTLMEYVLPCKYCRASFHEYLRLQPLTDAILQSRESFSRWMYDIHNRVNGKLRSQGLLKTANPSWTSVRNKYYHKHESLCRGSTTFIGWDFLSSIAYATPEADYMPVPMPDTPTDIASSSSLSTSTSLYIKNRYNLLTRAERLAKLHEWWTLIPSILPCKSWALAWKSSVTATGSSFSLRDSLHKGKRAMMDWMWAMESSVCSGLQCPTPHPSCSVLTREVSAFESDCGKKVPRATKKPTCRTLKKQKRRQVLTERRQRQKQKQTQIPVDVVNQ